MAKYWCGGLNPEPTVEQLALFKKHQRNGTSPGNPKWYRNPNAPRKPPPDKFGPPRYPRYKTGSQTRLEELRRTGNLLEPHRRAAGRPLREYVKAFDEANGFKKVSYPWSVDKT